MNKTKTLGIDESIDYLLVHICQSYIYMKDMDVEDTFAYRLKENKLSRIDKYLLKKATKLLSRMPLWYKNEKHY